MPTFVAASSGETLLKGPDWEEEGGVLYYEIQRQVPGVHFVPNAINLGRAGALIARFHEIGAGIDTFLINKSMYIGIFRQRGFEARERLRQQLHDPGTEAERQRVNAFFERFRHLSLEVYQDWRIVHGDLSTENILVAGDDLYLIDWDEIGLCPKTSDHGDLLGGIPGIDEDAIRALLDGYYQAGGHLGASDLEAIYNGMVLQGLRQSVEKPDGTTIGQVFDRFAFLLTG